MGLPCVYACTSPFLSEAHLRSSHDLLLSAPQQHLPPLPSPPKPKLLPPHQSWSGVRPQPAAGKASTSADAGAPPRRPHRQPLSGKSQLPGQGIAPSPCDVFKQSLGSMTQAVMGQEGELGNLPPSAVLPASLDPAFSLSSPGCFVHRLPRAERCPSPCAPSQPPPPASA